MSWTTETDAMSSLKNNPEAYFPCPRAFSFVEGCYGRSRAPPYEMVRREDVRLLSPCCHDSVKEDIASCAASLPSPSVMPWAKPSLSSWESHPLASPSSKHIFFLLFFNIRCGSSHPSLLNPPAQHHVLAQIMLKVSFLCLCCCIFPFLKAPGVTF